MPPSIPRQIQQRHARQLRRIESNNHLQLKVPTREISQNLLNLSSSPDLSSPDFGWIDDGDTLITTIIDLSGR